MTDEPKLPAEIEAAIVSGQPLRFTIAQIATALGVSTRTVKRKSDNGQIPKLHGDGPMRYLWLDEFIDAIAQMRQADESARSK